MSDEFLVGGPLPVESAADVLKELPETHKLPPAAPVRDALMEAFAAGYEEYQQKSVAVSLQRDPTMATGDDIASLATDRDIIPVRGESSTSLRARIFGTPEIVAPSAILNAVNGILAPYTTLHAKFIEPGLDGIFVHDGTATWDSFIGTNPEYPDRLYEQDALDNGGFFIADNESDAARPSWGLVRTFHLRLPPVEGADEDFAFVIDATDEVLAVGDGSDTSGAESDGSVAASIFVDSLTSEQIYSTIVSTVERIKGQGISWSASVDVA